VKQARQRHGKQTKGLPLTDEQTRLLEDLLDNHYAVLPREVRASMFEALGFSAREREKNIAQAKALMLWVEVDYIRSGNVRDTGRRRGAYSAAVEAVAQKHGMTRETLEQFIRRHPVPAKQRRDMRETVARHNGIIVLKPGRRVVLQFEPTE
jgi:hypothetical protein